MTEQKEIEIRKLINKHFTEVKGVYYISSHFKEGGFSQLDDFLMDLLDLWKTK